MNILALMPTYGKPARIVNNAIACFERQDYPAEKRRLLVYDDLPSLAATLGNRWDVGLGFTREPSLPAKYDSMLHKAVSLSVLRCVGVPGATPETIDALAVWDDDDIYLPWHLSAVAEALQRGPWCHPERIWSLYGGSLHQEPAAGRFHGALAMRMDAYQSVGGWVGVCDGRPKRADFDQRMIGALAKLSPPARPACKLPSYVYRWETTQSGHCSGLMRTPDDETWYDEFPKHAYLPDEPQTVTPELDAETVGVYAALTAPPVPETSHAKTCCT